MSLMFLFLSISIYIFSLDGQSLNIPTNPATVRIFLSTSNLFQKQLHNIDIFLSISLGKTISKNESTWFYAKSSTVTGTLSRFPSIQTPSQHNRWKNTINPCRCSWIHIFLQFPYNSSYDYLQYHINHNTIEIISLFGSS